MIDGDPLTGKPLTAKQAVARLNAGSLGVPAPTDPATGLPAPMPYTTAYDCRNQEKKRRAGHELTPLAKRALDDPAAVREDLLKRVVSLHEHEIHELELAKAKGKQLDPRLYGSVVKNTPVILGMLKPPRANGKPQPRREEDRPAPEPDIVHDLLTASQTS